MRLLAITSIALLASCTNKPVAVPVGPSIPPSLLTPAPGWQGSRPKTEQEFALALEAEIAGRKGANRKIATIAKIVEGGED
jgi:hypothetical protein